jgi:hypothetical protein
MTRALVLLVALVAGSAVWNFAAIPVGPGGTGVLALESAPGVSNWSTRSIAGGGSDITTAAALDAAVQLLDATSISNALTISATFPPSQNALARWNSRAHLLQTRVTGNRYTVLMATLQNKSALPITNLVVRYDYDVGAVTFEEILGFRAYYSFTGQQNSWQNIPEFSTGSPGLLTATLPLGSWAPDAPLYLLWADDRVTSADDAYYTLDNFAAWPLLPTNTFVPVLAGGTGTNDFSTYEQTMGWTGRPLTFGSHTNITNAVQCDAAVQKLSADDVARRVGATGTTPPDGGAYTDWHWIWQCLDTNPTGVDFAAVRVQLRNDTGADQSSLVVNYDCGDGGLPADEVLPVYRVYWNLTGLSNQWQLLPSLCGVTGRLSATLNLGHWPPGAPLYLLWVDDNSLRPSQQNMPREGSYTLDNFSAAPAPPFLAVSRVNAATNQITWPGFANGYTLTSTTNLLSTPWQPVSEPDVPATGFHRVSVSNSPARYFRLEKP